MGVTSPLSFAEVVLAGRLKVSRRDQDRTREDWTGNRVSRSVYRRLQFLKTDGLPHESPYGTGDNPGV